MLWKGFQRPKRLDFERDTLTDRFGRFSAQPFERGFGTTIGNALRRVLLSSIEGAAVTAVKIDGVLHEFSPIQGVVEDATDIILNLKQIPLKLHTDAAKTLYPAGRQGRQGDGQGHRDRLRTSRSSSRTPTSPPSRRAASCTWSCASSAAAATSRPTRTSTRISGIGWIPIDSVHSPVKKVNYLVEAARLGQTTDYDKLTIDVWTNGSVTPTDAVSLSAKLIRDHMSIFVNLDDEDEPQTEAAGEGARVGGANEHLDKSVEELELSVRSYNCLKNANIRTIRELVQKTEGDMLKTKNFGRKSLNEIKEILPDHGPGPGDAPGSDGTGIDPGSGSRERHD